ncbi:POTRA domain-containing protein [Trichormus sp. NMC-1]|uniref:POTRA domain-containing protein n=1 Tax=Trichormus sp. NMC-1 TaxID=1853259 RepID=UPI0008DC2B11|nr:POTRA domain-containing protein [Trichormus sp. NMC-1]
MLTLENGGIISAASLGSGDAGNITIDAGLVQLLGIQNPGELNSRIQASVGQLPNPIIPQKPELTPVQPEQSPPTPLETNPPIPQPGEISPQIPGTIRVEGVEFEGNTAFSDRQLAEVTKPFTDREITFGELIAIETAITQKYVEAGYINSGAVISANQTFPREGGVVKIQIIEGELTENNINMLIQIYS